MAVEAVTPPTDEDKSRAMARAIEPGNSAVCVQCGEQIKFRAKLRLQQIICNVYVDGQWNRVEHYHVDCYTEAGTPYGPAAEYEPNRRRGR